MTGNAGVAVLPRRELEQSANVVLQWFDATLLEEPRETPIMAIVERLASVGRLSYRRDVDLGRSRQGRKILGAFDFAENLILVDPVLFDATRVSRFRFTLAHELGHYVLHRGRRLDWSALDVAPNRVDDHRIDLDFLRRRSKINTPREWLEWQANKFASSLLMPATTLSDAIVQVQREAGITRRVGRVYLDDQQTNRVMFARVLHHLQDVYQVSRTMAVIRLKELSLIEDRRTAATAPAFRLFSQERATP